MRSSGADMTIWNKVITTYMALILGGTLVLASHLLTMRSMSGELERWRSLGYTLTQTAEHCVALLPASWVYNGLVRQQIERGKWVR
jgi:hypothetical protein